MLKIIVVRCHFTSFVSSSIWLSAERSTTKWLLVSLTMLNTWCTYSGWPSCVVWQGEVSHDIDLTSHDISLDICRYFTCHRMIQLLYCIMTGSVVPQRIIVWLSGDHHVIRSYRSVGDETFMRAFETATLGYEEWTHEVRSHLPPSLYPPREMFPLSVQAHVRMAWNYLTQHGREKASPIIK